MKKKCPNCSEDIFYVYFGEKTKFRCIECDLVWDKSQLKGDENNEEI